jgi:hypothetical protein
MMTCRQLAQCSRFARKIFKSKDRMRKVFANEPFPEKMKDLVRLQSIARKFNNILPWRI